MATSKHRTIRENDELVCTCGLRWGINESDPHNMTECRYRRPDDPLGVRYEPIPYMMESEDE